MTSSEIYKIRDAAQKYGMTCQVDSLLHSDNVAILDCVITDCAKRLGIDREKIATYMSRPQLLSVLTATGFDWNEVCDLVKSEYTLENFEVKSTKEAVSQRKGYAKEMNGLPMFPTLIPSWYAKPHYWEEETNEMTYFLANSKKVRGFYNSMHVGPKGVGKTEYAHMASLYMFGKPAVIIDPAQTPSKVVGSNIPVVKPSGDAEFVFTASRLAKVIQEPGIVVLDEYGATSKQCTLLYNTILASGTMETPDGEIERHKHCIIMCFDNSTGNGGDGVNYIRNAIDASTMDRFMSLVVDDWDHKVAVKVDAILRDNKDEKAPYIDEFCSFMEAYNKSCIMTGNLKATRYYRSLMAYTFKMEAGTPIRSILKSAVVRDLDKQRLGSILEQLKKLDSSTFTRELQRIHAEMPAKRTF